MEDTSNRKLHVAVLMGGQSSEHEVSLASGLRVLAALNRSRYDVTPITVSRAGTWLLGTAPDSVSLEAGADGSIPARAPGGDPRHPAPPAGGALEVFGNEAAIGEMRRERRIDVVFLALHGAFGEDGTVQGLLTLAGIPFTGSGVLASALAMDKVKAKELYHFHGIPVAKHFVVQRRMFFDEDQAGREALARLARKVVGLPCVVKPVTGGSSVGTTIVRDKAAMVPALAAALALDARALVEEYVEGKELTCGVLGGGPHEPPQALPVTEIVPRDGTFFDYRAKYTKDASDEITPARITDEVAVHVQDLAVQAHEALGCEGMSRSDFILRGEQAVILETNTIPGLTEMSLLPQAAAQAGIPFTQLLDRLIESALRRVEGLPQP